MADPFIGQLKLFAGNFAPVGWVLCNGQLLSISENDSLFSLIGTTFGGDGQSTFAVPDLRGRVPVGPGTDPNGNTSEFSAGVTATPLPPSSLSGVVWEDFNDDGQVDFGEQGISGVTVTLSGTDFLGNAVNLS